MILPYLKYGLLLWGTANVGYMNKVYRLQKRALRIITNSAYLCPTKPLFKKFNMLNIFDMYTNELAIFMYKYKNGMLPPSFNGIFITHLETHKYNTRNKSDFQLPMQKGKNIFTLGPKIWNNLPKVNKIAGSLGQFKMNLKMNLKQMPLSKY